MSLNWVSHPKKSRVWELISAHSIGNGSLSNYLMAHEVQDPSVIDRPIPGTVEQQLVQNLRSIQHVSASTRMLTMLSRGLDIVQQDNTGLHM